MGFLRCPFGYWKNMGFPVPSVNCSLCSNCLRAVRLRFGGSISWRGLGITLVSTAFRPALESTQSPIQWVKRLEREADHLLPSSAEVKNAWLYTSTPIRLHGVVLS
jgi:hypothetical protein